jgi:hypothetical protein
MPFTFCKYIIFVRHSQNFFYQITLHSVLSNQLFIFCFSSSEKLFQLKNNSFKFLHFLISLGNFINLLSSKFKVDKFIRFPISLDIIISEPIIVNFDKVFISEI